MEIMKKKKKKKKEIHQGHWSISENHGNSDV